MPSDHGHRRLDVPRDQPVSRLGVGLVTLAGYDERLCEVVRQMFKLSPRGIIEYLNLRRPIYRATAAGGHFGRSEATFSWEKTDRTAELAEAAGLVGAAK